MTAMDARMDARMGARMDARPPVPRFRDTLASELLKAVTLRATVPLLVLAAAVAVGIGAILANAAATSYPGPGPLGGDGFDPVATILSAVPYAGVIVAAMAVTLVTSEDANGVLRLTLTVTPARWRVLGAKLLTAAGSALVFGTLTAGLAVAVGLRVVASRGVPTPALSDGGVVAAIAGAGAGIAMVALVGTCLGLAFRRTAPAVGLANVIVFLPGILYGLPAWWQRTVVAYLPTSATGSLAGTLHGSPATLPAGTAVAVVACWTVVLVLAAGAMLTRRDA
jgi:hypothetical protein